MHFVKMWESKGWGILGGEDSIKAVTHGLRWATGRAHDNEFYVLKEGHVATYVAQETLTEEARYGLAFYTDQKKIQKLLLEEKIQLAKCRDYAARLTTENISNMSVRQLADRIDEGSIRYIETYGLFYATQPQYLELFVEQTQQELAQFGITDYADFLTLTTPLTPSIIVQEEIALREVFLKLLAQEDAEKSIAAYLEKYRYLYALEGATPKTKESILNEFATTPKKATQLTNEITLRKQSYVALCNQQVAILKKHPIPRTLLKKITLLQHIGNARLALRYAWASAVVVQTRYSKEATMRCGVETTSDYTTKEVEKLLIHKIPVPQAIVDERRKLSIVGVLAGKMRIMWGAEAEAFVKKYVPQEILSSQVHGMVASKGSCEGIARVITPAMDIMQEIGHMQKGEILVTNQTRPFMMPAIYKARALVTDDGGITSHAAIVSREFNLPCIVGTHNATQVFKTGDKILVDAINGIAKKL